MKVGPLAQAEQRIEGATASLQQWGIGWRASNVLLRSLLSQRSSHPKIMARLLAVQIGSSRYAVQLSTIAQ